MKEKPDSYYEDQCYRAVESVLGECQYKDRAFTKKALKAAYPFGDREGRKYKIWNKIFNHALDCLDTGSVQYTN